MEPDNASNITSTEQAENRLSTLRKYNFGDIVVEAAPTTIIDPERMQVYKDRFKLFKSLIDSTDDYKEKAFLSYPGVFTLVMGLDPVKLLFPEEARVLFKALRKTDQLNKFAIVEGGKYIKDPTFIHLEAAQETLKDHTKFLNTPPIDTPIPRDELTEKIILLHNQKSKKMAERSAGIFSGIPQSAVEFFTEGMQGSEGSNFPLYILQEQSFSNLLGTGEFQIPEAPDTSEGRLRGIYLQPYTSTGNIPEHTDCERIAINGFGVTYATQYPPAPDQINLCQRIIELDRQLGVSDYVQDVRSDIITHLYPSGNNQSSR